MKFDSIIIMLNSTGLLYYFFRSIVEQYGLWDHIRVDHGKEWYLMLFIQEQLAHLRRNTNRAPHVQTTSKSVSADAK